MLIKSSDLTVLKDRTTRRAVVIPWIHLGTAAGTLFMQNGHDGCFFLNVRKVFRKYLLHVLVYHMELCSGNSSANKTARFRLGKGLKEIDVSTYLIWYDEY